MSHPSREWVLSLRGFGVAFGEEVVLASVDLDVPPRGLVCLVGEAGAGKSTLLRTLAGLNDAQPAFRTWGEATYLGAPLGEASRPAVVQQKSRLLTSTVRENLVSALRGRAAWTQPEQNVRVVEVLRALDLELVGDDLKREVIDLPVGLQRRIAIARAAIDGAALVGIDEPTAGLSEPEAEGVLSTVERLARDRAVIVVTHNRAHAKRLGGSVALLAGGRICERRRVGSFFDRPASPPGQSFVRSGRCNVAGPMSRPGELRDSVPPPPPLPEEALARPLRAVGPRHFYWLMPGRLGGLPRPGIVAPLERDLEGLRRLGVTVLVNLEEHPTVPEAALIEHGLRPVHFPIDDMKAPSLDRALGLCRSVEDWLAVGEVVAMHCRAGQGRTGTMLACQLVHRGVSALDALERVRAIHPRWVQSDEQIAFLARFGLRGRGREHPQPQKKTREV